MTLDPGARQARSDRAKRMHEQGKLGPPAKRAKLERREQALAQREQERVERALRNPSLIALDLLSQNRAKIEETVRDVFEKGTRAQRLQMIDLLIKHGLSTARLGLDTRATEAKLSRDEAVAYLAQKLTEGPSAVLLRQQLERQRSHGVIEGHASDFASNLEGQI